MNAGRAMMIDLFAGGGGASHGIELATGRSPDVAVNHNAAAIAMHAANHPDSIHLQEDVFAVDPAATCAGRDVRLLWASPDCTHFSRAKGGTPRDGKIRGLAWVIVDWAAAVRPSVMCMENVPEFQTWGPLCDDNRPDRSRSGETFREFIGALEQLGYVVEWRVLVAADYGSPTTRKRLFLVARCDGLPIRWPAPTHGPGRAQPWRTAAECIDWTIPCPSIFERSKPLAPATERRIAEGIRRFVLENPRPFIVNLTHGGRLESLDDPFKTITGAHRGEKAVIAPIIMPNNTNNVPHSAEEPVPTITTGNRNFLVAPCLIQTGYGERTGQAPRVLDLEAPLGTVVGGGAKHGLVAAFLAKHNGGARGGAIGQDASGPMHTVTAHDTKTVIAAHLTKFYGTSTGADLRDPMPTVSAGGGKGGGHAALVAAFLIKYYGSGGQWSEASAPLDTIVSKARMGLVEVVIEGEPYVVADIGMRMLQPRELARAQGFPDSYILTGSKADQIARIGNSVCPQVAHAVVAAQLAAA